jgi:hypothetical protein
MYQTTQSICVLLTVTYRGVAVSRRLPIADWMYRSIFLDLGTSWMFVVSFTPPPLYPGTHWIGGWVGPRTGLEHVEKRKFLTLPGLELRSLRRPARSYLLYVFAVPDTAGNWMNAGIGCCITRMPIRETVFRLYVSNSMQKFRCKGESKVSCYGISIRQYGVMSYSGYDTSMWSIEEEVELLLIHPECTRIGSQKFFIQIS